MLPFTLSGLVLQCFWLDAANFQPIRSTTQIFVVMLHLFYWISAVILSTWFHGNSTMVQLWMSAAFSGYMHWCKIQCKNFLGWSSFIRAAKSAKWVWIHSVCCCCSSSNIYAGMALPLFYITIFVRPFLIIQQCNLHNIIALKSCFSMNARLLLSH